MPRTARHAVVFALIPAVERFPDLPLGEPDLSGLSAADARLATAIYRTTIQRWLTNAHLLSRHLKQPPRKLPPETYAILLAGTTQLVFMDRLPAYAVIDESVRLAHAFKQVRTAGLVNAVLRKIADSVEGSSDEPWTPAPAPGGDRVPMAEGGVVKLRGNMLPKPDNLLTHLVVATSHPLPLLQRWFKLFGRERATELALHSLLNPPTFVVDREEATRWGGSHDELLDYLAADPSRRVQDPASLASVAALSDLNLQPRTILDLCAGRGTKTRQLQQLFPRAAITAHDPDDDRRADLLEIPGPPRITVEDPADDQRFDLIVLDVPCSNTGVLARRPGARYRATDANRASLVELQQQIITRALKLLATGGTILYCTCSIDPAENQQQAQWLIEQSGGRLVLTRETTLLPESGVGGYHDGSYHAIVGPAPG